MPCFFVTVQTCYFHVCPVTSFKCPDAASSGYMCHTTEQEIEAKRACGKLLSTPFTDCHSDADVTHYFLRSAEKWFIDVVIIVIIFWFFSLKTGFSINRVGWSLIMKSSWLRSNGSKVFHFSVYVRQAPDQNRTDTNSLEGYCSTIELQAQILWPLDFGINTCFLPMIFLRFFKFVYFHQLFFTYLTRK